MHLFEMFLQYGHVKFRSKFDDVSFDLAAYWTGQAASADSSNLQYEYGGIFSHMIAQYAGENYWYKHKTGNYPGFSLLPLAKLLEHKYKVGSTHPFIEHFKNQCGILECKSRMGLQKCKQCGVFHYCSRACQIRHWEGHKRDCKGKNHWILEFFPDLQL
mmetsp:Transcript_30400/g.64348  ORF Transcript_30400/g.64348 Transcript_30400/m.64348 type:complete len:159 (+) Transcript_30400:1299-1775(+)